MPKFACSLTVAILALVAIQPTRLRAGLITLNLPQGRMTGVSADGTVAIGVMPDGTSGSASHAFRWTASAGVSQLAPLSTSVVGAPIGAPRALTPDGSTIVGEQAGGVVTDFFGRKISGMQAVQWSAGGIQPLVNIG